MDLILDTCGLLSLSGFAETTLSSQTCDLISEADTLYVSACSLFEISIKTKKGNLDIAPFPTARSFWERVVERYGLDVESVIDRDFDDAVSLPQHHKDPFDRIIIAQALRLGSSVVTYDSAFNRYAIHTLS